MEAALIYVAKSQPFQEPMPCCGRRGALALFWITDEGIDLVECGGCGAAFSSHDEDHGQCESCGDWIVEGEKYHCDSEGIVWHRRCPTKEARD